ncbi:hypothetical protein VRZ08_05540 [Rhodopseudomonas sp. G2_2311]|uniref:hypothetical protein n=1 Tax=Rhodopseudomonas sp. G2_2311 TaxID=3114287 RepID=UPI0039C7095E
MDNDTNADEAANVEAAAKQKAADEAAKDEAAAKQKAAEEAAKKLVDDEAAQAAKIAAEDSGRSAVDRVIRRLNSDFCRDLPEGARSGDYDADADRDQRFSEPYEVPNGRYRVAGSDWVFEIKSKKLVSAFRATDANRWGGKGVVSVG